MRISKLTENGEEIMSANSNNGQRKTAEKGKRYISKFLTVFIKKI